MKAITAAQMRELDAGAIAGGIKGEILMERAGAGIAREIESYLARLPERHRRRLVFLAGKGNNGGDAYVAARYLRASTTMAIVIHSICPLAALRGDAALNAARLPDGITVTEQFDPEKWELEPGDILVDALLGTGISGLLCPPYLDWIAAINRSGLPVIALDLPSGLDGDTGAVAGEAVRADLTITVALPKHGFYLGNGPALCGCLRCVGIGIPERLIAAAESTVTMPFAADIAPHFGRLPAECHKNTRGRLAVLGGSAGYHGAPLLAALAAQHCGCGYVRLALPESVGWPTLAPASLVVNLLPDDDGGLGEAAVAASREILKLSDAIVVGPGMGRGRGLLPFLTSLWDERVPAVIDADALNLIAEVPEIYQGGDYHILTPHPGEMRRLLEGFELDRLFGSSRMEQAAGLAAASASTVVLKGHRTVIASPDGRLAVNSSGSPALARAGSGDCLAGVIGTLLAQGLEPFVAAESGVFIHGLAAELSPDGVRGTTVEKLITLFPAALRELSPLA